MVLGEGGRPLRHDHVAGPYEVDAEGGGVGGKDDLRSLVGLLLDLGEDAEIGLQLVIVVCVEGL